MLCDTRSAWPRSQALLAPAAEPPRRDALEERRREIRALLDEIRAPAPRPADIARAGEGAAEGASADARLDRIGARIAALDRAG